MGVVVQRRSIDATGSSYAAKVKVLHQEMLELACMEAVRLQVGLRVTEVGPGDLDVFLDPQIPLHEIRYIRDWAGRLDHHLPFPRGHEQEARPPREGRGPRDRLFRGLVPVFTATVTIWHPHGFAPA